jgi:hypothetical protein
LDFGLKGRESRRLGGWGFLLIVVCRGKEGRFFLREDGRLQMGDREKGKWELSTSNFQL